jgi:glycosyltransferase involved in cell wall biosynthesis
MEKGNNKSSQWQQESATESFMLAEPTLHLDALDVASQNEGKERDSWPIIVHCHLRWDFVWQRPQQIFSRLAQWHRILFIEDPIIRDTQPSLEISQPHENVIRLVPVLPPHLESVEAQCSVVRPMIEEALRGHPLLVGSFERAAQWFYSPMTAPLLLGKFGARTVVYDCMDELANFRFAPADIADREQFLLSHCDLVFTGGYQLYKSKSLLHDNVHFHGCGVDVAHFGNARLHATAVPASVADLARPVFGYFGVIDERLDYPMIEALAKANPEASIVMAGPLAKVEQHQLPHLPNIHWLGQQSYEDLPALVKGFDVCLMPFALNEATQFINPTKTLEYMAAGKPIVSTAIPDVVRNFAPIVAIADSVETFIEAVRCAWKEPNPFLIAQGLARADASSWNAIVSDMENQVERVLAPSIVEHATAYQRVARA